jgi:RNA polymerase sigma-70 factor (ECF subfamily)
MSDELLLERAKSGDQAAFVELYERHRNAVFSFAYRLLGSFETAEDVTHDCFLSLIRRPEGFAPSRGRLRTYLYAAARNLSLKYFRSAGREGSLDDLSAELPLPVRQQQPLHRLLDEELAQTVKEAVLSLPPVQREAIILFEYEGLALSEIAEVVGADIGAVKARLHRARERLRTTLQPYLNRTLEIATLERP